MTRDRTELNSRLQEEIGRAAQPILCKVPGETPWDLALSKSHWSERLRERLRALGWSHAELSRRSGVSAELIRKYVGGEVEKPRGDILPKLAKSLNVSGLWLEHGVQLKKMSIPEIGYVGAGERFFPENNGNSTLEIQADDLDLFAVTVRGNSCLPVYKPGEIVVCSRAADCVVQLRTGEAFLKKVMRGTRAGTYTLLSYNGEPLESVSVEWFAPVVMVLRRPSLLAAH